MSSLDFSNVTNKHTSCPKQSRESVTEGLGLFRPLKHKVKLSLFFQLASKEGGAQEGPGVFGH